MLRPFHLHFAFLKVFLRIVAHVFFVTTSSSFYKSHFPLFPMADFPKICHNDGTFKANDINLNCMYTIKVFGKSGTLMGLQFFIPTKKTCIS